MLDCTGTFNTPHRLGDGGIPAIGELAAKQHTAWGLEDVLGECHGQRVPHRIVEDGSNRGGKVRVLHA